MSFINIMEYIDTIVIALIQFISIYLCLTPKYSKYICVLIPVTIAILKRLTITFVFNNNSSPIFSNIINISCLFITIFMFYKENIRNKFLVFVWVNLINLLVTFVASLISATLSMIPPFNDEVIIISTFVTPLVLLAFYSIFIHFYKKINNKKSIKYMGIVLAFPVCQFLFLVLITIIMVFQEEFLNKHLNIESDGIYSTGIKAICICLLVSAVLISVVSDIILYRIQRENSKNQELKESLDLANYRNELELEYYQQMQANIDETRKIRHDFYNILSAINDANEISGELKDEIETTIRKSSTATFCQNDIVNLIIMNKNKICLENNISLDTDLDIPKEITVSKLDLLRVFSNILDNAIEANLKSNENRFITLNAKIRDNYLFISVKNPLNSKIIKKNKHYETTKKQKNQHGFGMIILEDIAKKYDGELIAENNENSFTTLISLKIT